MDPWVAAQAVQQSGTLDGSNYKAYLSDAKQLIAKYYDSSPAIPLPVAFDGAGSGTPSINGGCSGTSSYNCTSPSTTAKILCEAQRYSGIWYHWGGGHQGYTAYVASCPDPTNPPDNQAHGAPIDANGQSGNPSPCGVDCSGLVSLAVDGAFHQTFSWTVNDLEHDTVNWAPISINQAQPGDVVTHNDSGGIGEHVEIFVSYNASSGTVTSFGAHDTGTQTGQVTSSASYYNGGAYHYIGPTN